MDRRVVFPAPEGPIIARVDPGRAYPVQEFTRVLSPMAAVRLRQVSVISRLLI